MITRLWSIWVTPNGLHFLKYAGKASNIPAFTDWREADAKCNELNREAEHWRIERNAEEREARAK